MEVYDRSRRSTVGDHILEGVLFKIKLHSEKFKAELSEEDKEYLRSYKTYIEGWIEDAEAFASQNDIFIPSNKKGDAWVEDEKGNPNPHIKTPPA